MKDSIVLWIGSLVLGVLTCVVYSRNGGIGALSFVSYVYLFCGLGIFFRASHIMKFRIVFLWFPSFFSKRVVLFCAK